MMFKELINDLKKIKSPENIHEDIPDHLTAAAISSYMSLFFKEDPEMDPEDAFDMTRTMILKQLDFMLMEIMDERDDAFDMMQNSEHSPMNDPEFNKAIQKVIHDYNKKLDS